MSARVFCALAWPSLAASLLAQPAPVRPATTLNPGTFNAKVDRAPQSKLKITIAPKSDTGAAYKLYDSGGKEIATTALREGAIQAVVEPKQSYVWTAPATQRQALSLEGLQFPARYLAYSDRGLASAGGLFLRPARMPLTWDEKAKAYVTELVVGYEFQDGAEKPLPQAKTITFFSEGPNARIVKDSVTIAKSGASGYARVTLSTTDFSGETQFTARASAIDELKSSVTVRREPGVLKLALPSKEIAAFGIGSGAMTITLLARDGSPLAVEAPLQVQLSSKRLRVPALVEIPAGKTSVEVEFRSAGLGEDDIVAQSGTLVSDEHIRMIFPVAAMIAALGGGALGGVARFFRNRAGKGKSLLPRRLIEGILVGVIFVGAAWAGIVMVNLGAGVLSTPFGAFVLAALSGYVGCVILDRVTKRTFKNLDSEG